jgi:hypothetical protein
MVDAKSLSEKIITTLNTMPKTAISLIKYVFPLSAQVHEDQCTYFYKNRREGSVIRSHLYREYGKFEWDIDCQSEDFVVPLSPPT